MLMRLCLAVDGRTHRAAPRVLIVSAVTARVQSMRDAIQSAGCSVGAVAEDVPSALHAMARQRFDAVILGDADVYCVELARSTLGQGIPFALIEPSRKAGRHLAGHETPGAQVLH